MCTHVNLNCGENNKNYQNIKVSENCLSQGLSVYKHSGLCYSTNIHLDTSHSGMDRSFYSHHPVPWLGGLDIQVGLSSLYAPCQQQSISRQNNSQLFKIMGEPSKSHRKTKRLLVRIELKSITIFEYVE